MKILLLGAQGQLGRALGTLVPDHALKWGRDELDLTDGAAIERALRETRPSIVINAAGMTDVDQCEREPDRALALNAHAPGALARACKELDAAMVQVSTDYVFGADRKRAVPYTESEFTGPVNHYGMTKLLGEQCINDADAAYLIIRVCGLYGGVRKKPNFVDQVVEKARRGEDILLKFDQVYSPTYIRELAPVMWRLIQEGRRGVVHVVNTGPVSRSVFTQAILDIRGASVSVVVSHEKNKMNVPRPSYSALESVRIPLNEYMSDWRTALQNYLSAHYGKE